MGAATKSAPSAFNLLRIAADSSTAMVEQSTTTGGISNGVKFPYGTAKIEMLGEYKYWTVSSFNSTGVIYIHSQRPKR